MTSKRKVTEIDDFQPLIEIDDDGKHLPVVDLDCKQVRQEIQNSISSVAFFKKRDLKRSMAPVSTSPPLLPHSVSSPSSPIPLPRTAMHSPPTKKKRLSEAARPYDVSGIELQGEETESVPIYDSCHEIRKKLKVFLRNVSSNESALSRNRQNKDPHGNQSPAYYAAYVFEKTRTRDGKPKSQDRENSEKIWPRRVNIPSRCHVYMDQISAGDVEKRTFDNIGKKSDLGNTAVDRVHCHRGL
ncbi:uncharacterized protein Bfra_008630 [Botrytis fragariae]|uniref:Uncharacterized protein n=1 Tax=Botrytis fragariae TaxID=1964551 RepID=A0A8H6EGP1_9HELO|nr:uncharacterized protein Bfra_008630 [Botrytis fragariae]KAF5871607.1 hypothetical protein Bfra_008630 [Botrytis fragariae]